MAYIPPSNDKTEKIECEIRDGYIIVPSITIHSNGTITVNPDPLDSEVVLEDILDAETIDG